MANGDVWENEGGAGPRPDTPDIGATATVKLSNPKDALGVMKVPFSTISAPVMAEVGLAMLEGARKYGRHNYRVIGVRASVYYDAALRHLTAWWEGEDFDPDSGLHHVIKAMASLAVVRDAMIQQKFTDDRPPKTPADWQKAMNRKVSEITAKYPDAKAPYVQFEELGSDAK